MVEHLDAGGRYYRQVLEEKRFQPLAKFRLLPFPQNEPQARRRERDAQENLSQYPHLEEKSSLLINTYFRDGGTPAHILVIPRFTPDLLPDYHREPKEGEIFLVRAWNPETPNVSRTIPLLASEEYVVPSALRIASRRLKVPMNDIELDIRQVSREEFLEALEALSAQGERLSFRLQRLIREANLKVLADKRSLPRMPTRKSLAI